MATITEDYVSFEIAKLLKEKGFDEYVMRWYIIEDSGVIAEVASHSYSLSKNSSFKNGEIGNPTLQMAMKWLREKHNLSVEVCRTACGYVGCIVSIPSGTDIEFLEETGDDLSSGQYTKWEYACEAAIKYCLEQLIHIAKKI